MCATMVSAPAELLERGRVLASGAVLVRESKLGAAPKGFSRELPVSAAVCALPLEPGRELRPFGRKTCSSAEAPCQAVEAEWQPDASGKACACAAARGFELCDEGLDSFE